MENFIFTPTTSALLTALPAQAHPNAQSASINIFYMNPSVVHLVQKVFTDRTKSVLHAQSDAHHAQTIQSAQHARVNTSNIKAAA